MSIQDLLPVMQLILSFGNICIIGYAFLKFLGKPHNNLEARVATLEVKQMETETSLRQGNDKFREQNDKFREQNDVNEVILHSTLALIEFEMQYCLIEHKQMSAGLEKAKDDLNRFLAKR